MLKMLGAAVAAMALGCAGPASAGNLFVNGDFEQGATGFQTSLGYSPGAVGPFGTYDVVGNPASNSPAYRSFGDHTTGAGLMMIGAGGGQVWSQTVNVTPNTVYFLAWHWAPLTETADSSFYWIFPPGGTVTDYYDRRPPGIWHERRFTWNSGNLTQATFSLMVHNHPWTQNLYYAVDDISLGVPEPSTWAMMIIGFGGSGVALRRARKQAPVLG